VRLADVGAFTNVDHACRISRLQRAVQLVAQALWEMQQDVQVRIPTGRFRVPNPQSSEGSESPPCPSAEVTQEAVCVL
jgi:hypothetical protein